MAAKIWIRTVGTIASAAFFLVGLSSIPDNIVIWLRWFAFVGQYVPWWVFILASVGVAVLVWVPLILAWKRAPIQMSPAISQRSTVTVGLPRRVSQGPAVISVDMRLRKLLFAFADPAGNKAVELLNRLCTRLEGQELAKRYVAILVRRSVIDLERQVRTQLMDVLKTPEEGKIPSHLAGKEQLIFGNYYELYQSLSTWIHQVAELLGLDLGQDQEYKQWRKADDEFLTRLRELSVEREYRVLDNEVRRVGWGENFRIL